MTASVNIRIDKDLCVGCKLCLKTCYEDVYHWDEEEEKPVAAHPEDCVFCLQCEMACTAECIEVMPTRSMIHDPF